MSGIGFFIALSLFGLSSAWAKPIYYSCTSDGKAFFAPRITTLPEIYYDAETDFLDVRNRDFSFDYSFDSPYLYITGTRYPNDPDQGTCGASGKLKLDSIYEILKEAVLQDVDPYLVLGIRLMEETPGAWYQLRLDRIANLAVMGCPGTRISQSQYFKSDPFNSEIPLLETYDRYYKIKVPSTPPRTDLSTEIERVIDRQNSLKQTPGLFCLQSSKPENGYLFLAGSTIPKSYCCIEVNRAPEPTKNPLYFINMSGTALSNTLTIHFIKNLFSNSTLPLEHQIQNYNGKTSFFYVPGLSLWRSGVNLKHYPIYGWATLDLMMNSLYPNFDIQMLVHRLKEETGKSAKSLICKNKQPGPYQINDDLYLNKIKNTPRLESTIQKSWDQLKTIEKTLLTQEFAEVFSLQERDKALSLVFEKYKKTVYHKRRSTLGKASGRSWRRLSPKAYDTLKACWMRKGYD